MRDKYKIILDGSLESIKAAVELAEATKWTGLAVSADLPKDILEALKKECEDQGLKFGIYSANDRLTGEYSSAANNSPHMGG